MAIYKAFDINTVTSVKPWGAREEQVIRDLIDTLVVDTIDEEKNTSGHLHGKIYADDSISSFDSSSTDSVTITMKDDESSGLVVRNRTGTSIIEIDSSTVTPKVTFNYDADIVGKLYGDIYDLYDNPMIETRNEESKIYYTSDKTAGHDFNLDTTLYTFRIHNDATEFFRIHAPISGAEATFDIPININDLLYMDAGIAMYDNTISYDGSAGTGIAFSSSFITASLPLKLNASRNNTSSSEDGSLIYTSLNTGAAYPYLEDGNLILQSSGTLDRDIVFITGNTPDIRMVIDSAGNVGIGTNDFTEKLFVNGNVGIQQGSSGSTSGNALVFKDDNYGTYAAAEIREYTQSINSGIASADLIISTRSTTSDVAPTERVRISYDGILSSGNTSSGTLGQIIIKSRDSWFRTTLGCLYSSGASYWGRAVKPDTTAEGFWAGVTDTTGGGAWVIDNDGSTYFTSMPSQSLAEDTTPGTLIQPFTIDADGKIGINTASPDTLFHVYNGELTVKASNSDNVAITGISNTPAILGADAGSATVTNNTRKVARVGCPSYTSDTVPPIAFFMIDAQSSLTDLYIGSGSSQLTSPTSIKFNVAPNITSTSPSTLLTLSIANGAQVSTSLNVSTISNASSDLDKFLVSDSGTLKYRTGSQLLSDLSGNCGAGFNWNSQSLSGINDIGCTTIDITSLTSGYVPYYTGSTLDDSSIYYNGSNTGIGTQSPSETFHIYGTPEIFGDERSILLLQDNSDLSQGNGGGLIFAGNDGVIPNRFYAGIKGIKANSTSGNYSGQLHFQTRLNGNTSATHMVIDENGKMGIGTNSPTQLLHIRGSSAPRIRIEDSDDSSQVLIGVSDGNGAFLQLDDDGGSDNVLLRSYGDSFLLGGGLGIGIENPQTTLDVYGTNLRIKGATTYTSIWLTGIGNPYYGSHMYMCGDAGSTQKAFRVGCGHVSSNVEFRIEASTNDQAYESNPNTLTYSEVFSIQTNGNVVHIDDAYIGITTDTTLMRLRSNEVAIDGILNMGSNCNIQLNSNFINNNGAADKGISFSSSGVFSEFGTSGVSGDSRYLANLYDDTSYGAGVGAGINLGGKFNSDGDYADFGCVKAIKANGTNGSYASEMHFCTRASAGNLTTHMEIDDSGSIYFNNLDGSTGGSDLRYDTSTKVVFYDTSALKYKENVRNDPDTSWLYDISVVMYDRKNGSRKDEIGIIADELMKIKPEYCSYKNGEIESYNKSDLVPVLLSEIQKHEREITQLKQEIVELKKAA